MSTYKPYKRTLDGKEEIKLHISAIDGSVPVYVVGTGTAGVWAGTIDGLTEYYHGLVVLYRTPAAGASTTTLNINGLGAKTIYRYSTAKLTTHYTTNAVIPLVYDSTLNGGCFIVNADYDSTDTWTLRPYYARYYAGANAVYRYKLCAEDAFGKIIPLTLEDGTGTSKTVQTAGFRPERLFYYGSTGAVSAGAAIGHGLLYSSYSITTCAYAFNSTIATYKHIYLKGTYDKLTGLFTLDNTNATSWYVQVPSNTSYSMSDYFDGAFQYIYLGTSYSSANYMYLYPTHTIYSFTGTALIRLGSDAAALSYDNMFYGDENTFRGKINNIGGIDFYDGNHNGATGDVSKFNRTVYPRRVQMYQWDSFFHLACDDVADGANTKETFYINTSTGELTFNIPPTVGGTAMSLVGHAHPIVDNLTSTDTDKPLSAYQGKLLNDAISAINTLLGSDNTSLDTLQEIVDYIENHQSVLNGISTSKVNVSDIINNLTSNVSNKPLSAAQGYALKALVDGKAASSHSHTISQITNFPSSLPASDVSSWAKAAAKPTYTASEVGAATSDHSHSAFVGEVQFSHATYCPTWGDIASGIGKSSCFTRGAFMQLITGQVLAANTAYTDSDKGYNTEAGKIKFQSMTANNGQPVVTDMAVLDSTGLTVGGTKVSLEGHSHAIPSATSSAVGGVKMRVASGILYIRNDGTNA